MQGILFLFLSFENSLLMALSNVLHVIVLSSAKVPISNVQSHYQQFPISGFFSLTAVPNTLSLVIKNRYKHEILWSINIAHSRGWSLSQLSSQPNNHPSTASLGQQSAMPLPFATGSMPYRMVALWLRPQRLRVQPSCSLLGYLGTLSRITISFHCPDVLISLPGCSLSILA